MHHRENVFLSNVTAVTTATVVRKGFGTFHNQNYQYGLGLHMVTLYNNGTQLSIRLRKL